MNRGIFVAFEGIDGSGKSRQARRVADSHNALYTMEPGGTPLGSELRRWLLDASAPMTAQTEALLMLADRAHHVADVIAPTLAAGTSVISDRFSASTIAYQGYGRGVDLAALVSATTLAIGDSTPDLTVLVDVTVDVARQRREHADRFEREGDDFFNAVRHGFLELAANDCAHWVVVDGSQSIDEVESAVDGALEKLAWPT
jgi:dTMP kinase